jgi:hypothetical protein
MFMTILLLLLIPNIETPLYLLHNYLSSHLYFQTIQWLPHSKLHAQESYFHCQTCTNGVLCANTTHIQYGQPPYHHQWTVYWS